MYRSVTRHIILVLFLLLATTCTKQESSVPVEVPATASAAKPGSVEDIRQRLNGGDPAIYSAENQELHGQRLSALYKEFPAIEEKVKEMQGELIRQFSTNPGAATLFASRARSAIPATRLATPRFVGPVTAPCPSGCLCAAAWASAYAYAYAYAYACATCSAGGETNTVCSSAFAVSYAYAFGWGFASVCPPPAPACTPVAGALPPPLVSPVTTPSSP